ncbi:MAG: M56 family metallopeptidase [Planctomycetota bacterium]
MPAEMPTIGELGGWLATYWVHALIAIAVTWALVRTLLRNASSGVVAGAWRAALVAPFVTTALRCAVVEQGPQIEVPWLESTASLEDRVEERAHVTARGERSGSRVAHTTNAAVEEDRFAASVDDLRATLARLRDELESNRAQAPVAANDAPIEREARDVDAAPPTERDTVVPAPAAASIASPPAAGGLLARIRALDPRRTVLFLAAGAALLSLARFLDGWLRLGRRMSRRTPLTGERLERARSLAARMRVRRVRFTTSQRLHVPMAWGYLRPEVCVPEGFEHDLEDDEWDAAIAHELAHLVRGDGLWLPLLRLGSRVFAFQPLNLFAWRELWRTSELAADEEAVRHTNSPRALALCLAKVATRLGAYDEERRVASTGAPAMAVRPALVVQRTQRLVRSVVRRPTFAARSLALVPTFVVSFAGPRLAPLLAEPDAPARPGTEVLEAPRESVLPDALRADLATPESANSTTSALLDELAAEVVTELDAVNVELRARLAVASPAERERLAGAMQRLDALERLCDVAVPMIQERRERAKSSASPSVPDTTSEVPAARETDR